MAEHAKFRYRSLDEVKEDISKLGVIIPISQI